MLTGDAITQITALEGAILILSAYLHDIGMVFTEDERLTLKLDPAFQRFLNQNPAAFVKMTMGEDLPVDVAESYCRWIHPDRVHVYLGSLDPQQLRWGTPSIARHVGVVCESHGWDTAQLKGNSDLLIDFLAEADLLFCAIILRLADILDFDNSRSPEEVYAYLGIGQASTPRKKQSDVEWQKHLCSDGFRFPSGDNKGHTLTFIAGPDHPAVEYDVRCFLDVIEEELKKSGNLLRFCSERWRTLELPQRIDRRSIISKDYMYGEYRFTIDHDQILQLLMGENLYADPYVFVRELLQNAIDATRHRVYFETSTATPAFRPQPIVISSWTDSHGYQWVRIDDHGMGMNEDIIVNYFLKVGRSYYQSSEFRAEVLRYKTRQSTEFVPISRFGIGVLSCFIVADMVEISTRRVPTSAQDTSKGIRLSMTGTQSFYVLRREGGTYAIPDMPNASKTSEAYRQGVSYGSSVAVRLDPRRNHLNFDVGAKAAEYVVCPPIPMQCGGKAIGEDYEASIGSPCIPPLEMTFSDEEMATVEKTLQLKFSAPLKVRILPLDLSKHSLTPNLAGQAILGYVSVPQPDRKKIADADSRIARTIEFELQSDSKLTVTLHYEDKARTKEIDPKRERVHLHQRELIARTERIAEGLDRASDGYAGRRLYESVRELEYLSRSAAEPDRIFSFLDEVARMTTRLAVELTTPEELFIRARQVKDKLHRLQGIESSERGLSPEATRVLKLLEETGDVTAPHLRRLLYDFQEQRFDMASRDREWLLSKIRDLLRSTSISLDFEQASNALLQSLGTDLMQSPTDLWSEVEEISRGLDRLFGSVVARAYREAMDYLGRRYSGESWHTVSTQFSLIWNDFDAMASTALRAMQHQPESASELRKEARDLSTAILSLAKDNAALTRDLRDAKRTAVLDASRILVNVPTDVKGVLLSFLIQKEGWLSHNGIRVPTEKGRKVSLNNPAPNGWIRYRLALYDELRPDLSVSRDELKAFSWLIHSHVALTFARALKEYDGDLEFSLNIFEQVIGEPTFALSNFLIDGQMATSGEWARLSIIPTTKGLASLEAMRKCLEAEERYEIPQLMSINHKLFSASDWGRPKFLDCCAAAIVQIGLNVHYDTKADKYVVLDSALPVLKEGQRLFPPLFFVPYSDSGVLRKENRPLNQLHPLASWLLEKAVDLQKRYPGLLDAIRAGLSNDSLFNNWDQEKRKAAVGSINDVLARLRETCLESIAPPSEIVVTESDFVR